MLQQRRPGSPTCTTVSDPFAVPPLPDGPTATSGALLEFAGWPDSCTDDTYSVFPQSIKPFTEHSIEA